MKRRTRKPTKAWAVVSKRGQVLLHTIRCNRSLALDARNRIEKSERAEPVLIFVGDPQEQLDALDDILKWFAEYYSAPPAR